MAIAQSSLQTLHPRRAGMGPGRNSCERLESPLQMERAQANGVAQRFERSRTVRMRVDIAADLLHQIRIGIRSGRRIRLATFARTKACAPCRLPGSKKDHVLSKRPSGGTGRLAVDSGG